MATDDLDWNLVRYQDTLHAVTEGLALARTVWANGPDAQTNWVTPDSGIIGDLEEDEREFIAAHSPAVMIRVYEHALAILEGHPLSGARFPHCSKCHPWPSWPCGTVTAVMDVWNPA